MKAGDKVVCIDSSNHEQHLIEGYTYTVAEVTQKVTSSGLGIYVEEIDRGLQPYLGYIIERFEAAPQMNQVQSTIKAIVSGAAVSHGFAVPITPVGTGSRKPDMGDKVQALISDGRIQAGQIYTVSAVDFYRDIMHLVEYPQEVFPANWFALLTGCPVIEKHQELPQFRCECGVDTLGSGKHSDWCPKSK